MPDAMVELYAKAEQDILADMARRINGFDMFIPSAKFQMQCLEEMGELREDIVAELSRLTGKSTRELERIMSDAGMESLKADEDLYKRAGLSSSPLASSSAVRRALTAGLQKTGGVFKNLTKTTANTASKQFEDALDRAYMQITSGAIDYNTAVTNAIKDLARDGVGAITYPSGKVDTIETAVRRATVTGVNQTTAKMQEARMDEMGIDLVEVTAHAGARPSHATWQGKIYAREGKSEKYRNLAEATGYGSGEGLCGWNCSHSFHAYIEGFPRSYSSEQLKDLQAETVEYNGKKMTRYEAQQEQRKIERNIRKYKREDIALTAAGRDSTEAKALIGKWQKQQADFIKQTGFKPQAGRTVAGGYDKAAAAKTGAVNRKISSIRKSVVGVKSSTGVEITDVAFHAGIRTVERGVSAKSITDALQNPVKVGKIRKDGSQQFRGADATVAINPKTGNIITVWAKKPKEGGSP